MKWEEKRHLHGGKKWGNVLKMVKRNKFTCRKARLPLDLLENLFYNITSICFRALA